MFRLGSDYFTDKLHSVCYVSNTIIRMTCCRRVMSPKVTSTGGCMRYDACIRCALTVTYNMLTCALLKHTKNKNGQAFQR